VRQNFHQWDRHKVPGSFEAALHTYPERLLEPAYYAKHLERWLHHFDSSQLLVVLYDDICTRPREVLNTVYAFLGVDSTFIPPTLHHCGASVRHGTSPRTPLLGRLHAILYDQLSRQVYYRCKQLVGTRTAVYLKEMLRIRDLMEGLFLQPGYPEMRPQTRALLRDRFADDIQNLQRLTGHDLSHWQ
jgi:hypothetical protein